MRPLPPKLERFDSNLADPVRRAGTGCPLHIAEAASTVDSLQFFCS